MKRSLTPVAESNTMPTRHASPPPPDGLPVYRVLTGPDDARFCHRVSEALALGYRLHGAPAATFDGQHVILAQAIVWPSVIVESSQSDPGSA